MIRTHNLDASENDRPILFLTCNDNTLSLYEWLMEREKNVILYRDRIDLPKVVELNPRLMISYNYSFLIKEDVIAFMRQRIINLHISLLPWNRGADPNYWSFIEDTRKGVTIHLIDRGLDTGDILLQKEVFFDEEQESFRSSYQKLQEEICRLFQENWQDIKNNRITPRKQTGCGSLHYHKEFLALTASYPVDWDEKIAQYKRRMKETEGKD